MSFETLRKVFKHIHKLSSKDSFLGQITKANLRTHFDIYKKAKKQMKVRRYKQNDGQLLEAFEKFIEQATIQNSQISQKAKMKLIEICYGLNEFVDANFQLKKDFRSAQIKHLQSYEQYNNLQTEKQKEFVKKLIKEVIRDYETYPYSNLTDFFKDFRSETSKIKLKDISKIQDQSARQHISKIIQNKVYISPDYRVIYNLYFSMQSPYNIAFSDYINSRFIMIDFDDFRYAPARDQQQLENQTQLRRKLKEKRLQNIKLSIKSKEIQKPIKVKNNKIQVEMQKGATKTKNYSISNKPTLQLGKKLKDRQRQHEEKNTQNQKYENINDNLIVHKKQTSQKEQKLIDKTSVTEKTSQFRQKQSKAKIDIQKNQKTKIKKDGTKQQIIQNQKIDCNKKQAKGFFKKK